MSVFLMDFPASPTPPYGMLTTARSTCVFLQQFCRRFETTGAILPSSRFLASELAGGIRWRKAHLRRPLRILEVGPGTGPATEEIARLMGPEDTLDLVEVNEQFARFLSQRVATEAVFAPVRDRIQIYARAIEHHVKVAGAYDILVSGLPFNNFSAELVSDILEAFDELSADGCHWSFFEYYALRSIKLRFVSGPERQRLLAIDRLLQERLRDREDRQIVWANIPPALVRHSRRPTRNAKSRTTSDPAAVPQLAFPAGCASPLTVMAENAGAQECRISM